jgi:hypothetical protein
MTPTTMNPATPGAMYEAGAVSGPTKENTRIPAAVSHAGTNAAIPSSGMIRCSSGFQRRPPRRDAEAKYPMQAALHTMYTATRTSTIPVPTMANALVGL